MSASFESTKRLLEEHKELHRVLAQSRWHGGTMTVKESARLDEVDAMLDDLMPEYIRVVNLGRKNGNQ